MLSFLIYLAKISFLFQMLAVMNVNVMLLWCKQDSYNWTDWRGKNREKKSTQATFVRKNFNSTFLKFRYKVLLLFASCVFWSNWSFKRLQNPFLLLTANIEHSYLKNIRLSEIYLTFNTSSLCLPKTRGYTK